MALGISTLTYLLFTYLCVYVCCVVDSDHLMSILPVICHQVQMTTYKLDISSIQSAAVTDVDNIIRVCLFSLLFFFFYTVGQKTGPFLNLDNFAMCLSSD